MSDQERDKHVKRTDDEGAEVEAHKHGHREQTIEEAKDDDSNAVEAHKHGGKDS